MNDGGPAFPVPEFDGDGAPGMMLRDWFAGMIVAQLAMTNDPQTAAKLGYEYADAVLAERDKKAGFVDSEPAGYISKGSGA